MMRHGFSVFCDLLEKEDVRLAFDRLDTRLSFNVETLTYGYDAAGGVNLISARYSYSGWNTNGVTSFSDLSVSDTNGSHPEWNYIYDALGRLSQVNSNSTGADASYTYTDVGNLETTSYRNGVTTTYTYNARNWLQMLQSTLGGTNIATFDYDGASGQGTWSNDRKLSPTGQRRQMYENVNGAVRTVAYDYDRLYRLVREDIAAPSTNTPTGLIFYGTDQNNMGYDAVGNRQSRQVTSTSTPSLSSLGIDTFNGQSFDEKDRFSGGFYQYDASGNTTNDLANAAYVYDAENRLILRSNGGLSTVIITYDAEGNRVGKTVITNGVTNVVTYLVEDRNPTGYSQVMEERDSTGTGLIAYEYGLALVSEKTTDGVFYYGFDGLGTTRYLTSCGCVGGASVQVTDTYTYDAFGIQIAGTGSTQNHYRYTGQQWDEDLGMYYLRARYYAPQLGRFWTMDSYEGNLEDPLSLHKYLYCSSNPMNCIDLEGHEGELMTAITVVSIAMNLNSAYHHALNKEYGKMTLDLAAAFSGGFGIAGGAGMLENLLPASLRFAGSAVTASGALVSAANALKGISIIIAGTDLMQAMLSEDHHILTDKNYISKAPDGLGPFTPQFEDILEGTGIKLSDAINRVKVLGHSGPHPEANLYTLNYLKKAIAGLTKYTKEYNTAVEKAIRELGVECATPGSALNKLLVDR